MKFVILFVLCTLVLCDNIPEFKASINLHALDNIKFDFLAPLIDKNLKDLDLPLDLELEQKIPVIGTVKIAINQTHLNQMTVDWSETNIRPYKETDDTIYVRLSKISVSLSTYMSVHAMRMDIVDSMTSIDLHNLSLQMAIRFDATNKEDSWGFIPYIIDNSVNLDEMSISIENSMVPKFVLNALLKGLAPMLPSLLNGMITSKVAPALVDMSQQSKVRFTVPIPTTESAYILQVDWTEPPKVLRAGAQAYLNVAINLDFVNAATGTSCPVFDIGNLPDRVYKADQDIEITAGGNLIDQFLWVLLDSGIVNIYVNDDQLKGFNLPIALTTSGLKLLAPSFEDRYGKDKKMYIHISRADPIPNMYVRSGRLLGSLQVRLEFIVDTDGSLYPQENMEECTTCVSAHVADVTLASMLTAYNKNETHIAANIITVNIVSMEYVSGEIQIENKKLVSTLNSLLSAMIPQINVMARDGIENPAVGLVGLQELDVVMGDTFMTLALYFNEPETIQSMVETIQEYQQ